MHNNETKYTNGEKNAESDVFVATVPKKNAKNGSSSVICHHTKGNRKQTFVSSFHI